jgi:hypothetical protein
MSNRQLRPRVISDANWPGMYRVRWPDGTLSDMVNLTRAKDAIARIEETAERHKRGAAEPQRKPLVRFGVAS